MPRKNRKSSRSQGERKRFTRLNVKKLIKEVEQLQFRKLDTKALEADVPKVWATIESMQEVKKTSGIMKEIITI